MPTYSGNCMPGAGIFFDFGYLYRMSRSFRYFFVLVPVCLLVCFGFVFLLFMLHGYPELMAVTQKVWRFSEPGTPHRTSLLSPQQVNLIRFGLGAGLAPLPVFLAQRILPYERLLVYKSFFDLLLLILVLVLLLKRWLNDTLKVRSGVAVLALLFGLYHSYKIRFIPDLDRRTCPPDTIQRALKQYGDPDKPIISEIQLKLSDES